MLVRNKQWLNLTCCPPSDCASLGLDISGLGLTMKLWTRIFEDATTCIVPVQKRFLL